MKYVNTCYFLFYIDILLNLDDTNNKVVENMSFSEEKGKNVGNVKKIIIFHNFTVLINPYYQVV